MNVPFDNNSGERFSFDVNEGEIDAGDGIVLVLNRKACESFAKLFTSLAESEESTHLHLGYDHECPQGPGFRIEVNDDL